MPANALLGLQGGTGTGRGGPTHGCVPQWIAAHARQHECKRKSSTHLATPVCPPGRAFRHRTAPTWRPRHVNGPAEGPCPDPLALRARMLLCDGTQQSPSNGGQIMIQPPPSQALATLTQPGSRWPVFRSSRARTRVPHVPCSIGLHTRPASHLPLVPVGHQAHHGLLLQRADCCANPVRDADVWYKSDRALAGAARRLLRQHQALGACAQMPMHAGLADARAAGHGTLLLPTAAPGRHTPCNSIIGRVPCVCWLPMVS